MLCRIKNMTRNKTFAFLLAFAIGCGCLFGCNAEKDQGKTTKELTLQEYEEAQFILSGYWQPHDLTVESFTLYKNAGLNNLLMGYHDDDEWSSGSRSYLGSEQTLKNLELCREVGLTATLNFGEIYKKRIDGTGYGETPFSDYDLYGEYKDIITSVHIYDEPRKEHIDNLSSTSLISDYKSVYSVPYYINLYPDYANVATLGFKTYDEYLDYYDEKILSQFEDNKMVSVDYYPFRASGFQTGWLANLKKIAELSKKHSARTNFYIQTAEGNEFKTELSEQDIRLQVYVSLAFGATNLSYYCYSDPNEDGDSMYEYCMLNPDKTPSVLYSYVKEINEEISSFSSAFLAYSWVECMGYTDTSDGNGSVALAMLRTNADFSDRRYVASLASDGDCLIGVFERESDEAYMLVNYGDPEVTSEYVYCIELKNGALGVAVYGGDGNIGSPEIIRADDNGKCDIKIKAGEGKFVVPLI